MWDQTNPSSPTCVKQGELSNADPRETRWGQWHWSISDQMKANSPIYVQSDEAKLADPCEIR